jgi:AcrR family transcriptional regulator
MTSGAERNAAGGVRARVRAEMIGEIKAVARRHLASDGANLSLRAIARDMGMVSSALYRYFASRDDLLTALIMDAYNDMGDAAESADAGVADRADGRARWLTVTRALRRWALAHPAEYTLLYGSPVPGYAAPPDTTPPASRTARVLAEILADAPAVDDRDIPLGPALRGEIHRIAAAGAPRLDDSAMVRALVAWTLVFGALNFELFGRIDTLIDERDEWFDVQMRSLLDYLGVPERAA